MARKYDKRLYELAVYISSLMISTARGISQRKAKQIVVNLIESGHAKNKFIEWIKYQGGDLKKLKDNAKKYIVMSQENGYVNKVDSLKLAKLVYDLGAGRHKKTDKIDYAVGVILNKTIGSKVTKGEILGVVFYNKKVKDFEERFVDAFTIEKKKKPVKKIILKTVK